MNNVDEISELFQRHGIQVAGNTVEDQESGAKFIFISAETDKSGKQHPTNYSISKVERLAKAKYGDVFIVLLLDEIEDIKTSIKSLIIRQYGEDVRNIFSNVNRDSVVVWVEPRTTISLEKIGEIEGAIRDFVCYFKLRLEHLIDISRLKLPSEKACISALRMQAPATEGAVADELQKRGFDVPNEEWLKRLLDRNRKRKLIHRKQDGRFIMTLSGLRASGSGKTRNSPDVRRALELARRHA